MDDAPAPADAKLVPPPTKGHLSVARLARHWYVACRASELRRSPLARTILGIPFVLFRDAQGRPAALLDRCAHRNVPLSLGRVVEDGTLRCAYHGWRYDGSGRCTLVPGLLDGGDGKERRVSAAAVREQDGFVWIHPALDETPTTEPFALPQAAAKAYSTVVRELEMEATVHAVVENALDVPHTAFLHRGLFRGGTPHEVTAVVRRGADRVECEYVGEPRPEGFLGRLLAPGGGVVQHWDRFVLPSVAEVEYRLGDENHLVATSLCTPVSDTHTRIFAVVSLRLRAFTRAVARIVQPVALRILRQDAAILAAQTAAVRRFGGEQYMSTDLDFLGGHVWRLLKEAERGVAGEAEGGERRVRFVV